MTETTLIPEGRIHLRELAGRQYAGMLRLSESVELDPSLRELIDIRVSQINGCAFCLDMHWKDARARGATDERLYMLAAWRESPLYTERERAALALAEAITLISDGQVPDEVWSEAVAQLEEAELGQVIFAATTINAWNRLSITSRATPGYYTPGMFAG